MKRESQTRRFLREAIGALILGAVILYLIWMAGYLSPVEAGAKPRPTPTCETIAEGLERCGVLRTSVARPNQHNRPVKATPT
jgi:hypothetical protein